MPTRDVHQGDAVAWLRERTFSPEQAVVTSLPDLVELPTLGTEGWRTWFTETAELICRQAADEGLVIFYQTDVKREGRWIDKGYLVQTAAERAGSSLLWHKIVCRAPAGIVTFGRPAYAHLLCFSRTLTLTPDQSSADVLPTMGAMTWPRAMGKDACDAVCRFLIKHTCCTTVIDPFCGVGTMLAAANAHGLDAIGVELSAKRAEKARNLVLAI